MQRGDLVSLAVQGDFGKPRPALVMQSDWFDKHPTVTLLPLTSDLQNSPMLRVTVRPSETNRLVGTSQVMIDKATTVRREKIGSLIGRLEADRLIEIERCWAVFLGIAK
jgi:mRNA interferase MazF